MRVSPNVARGRRVVLLGGRAATQAPFVRVEIYGRTLFRKHARALNSSCGSTSLASGAGQSNGQIAAIACF